MVSGLLLASVPLSDAAQNSKDSTQSPNGQKNKDGNNQKDDATVTTQRRSDSPTSMPSIEAKETPNPAGAASSSPMPGQHVNSEKSVKPIEKSVKPREKSVKPRERKTPKPGKGENRSSKGDVKKITNGVKNIDKEKKAKVERNSRARLVRANKVSPTVSKEPALKEEVVVPTPSASPSPSSQPAELSAEIEKSNGNKATLVVSGVKEGTKVKVVITKKESKNK